MMDELEFNANDMIKLKVVDIDDYDYKLEKLNGDIISINMDIYGEVRVRVDNYIYMPISILKENVPLQFGPICNSKNEIIKMVDRDKVFYLQRYYG